MATSPVRRILVPVDLSAGSRGAFRFARDLASALGASIEVLHVIEPSDRLLTGGAPPPDDPDAARQRLQEFVGSAGEGGGVPVTERVESGDARQRIVSLAEQEGFDLIVMGTQGRTGRSLSLVGSVAESVVRTSRRPVLTVREG